MPHHATGWIVPQYARNTPVCIDAAVADDNESGMLRVAHADAAAMVQRHPGGAARGAQEGVEHRPVRNSIAAVQHRFRFPIGTRHRTAVEVVTAYYDRCLELAAPYHLVERETQPVALPESDPADSRGQPLKVNALTRRIEPVV